jgi:hypothetical protein
MRNPDGLRCRLVFSPLPDGHLGEVCWNFRLVPTHKGDITGFGNQLEVR